MLFCPQQSAPEEVGEQEEGEVEEVEKPTVTTSEVDAPARSETTKETEKQGDPSPAGVTRSVPFSPSVAGQLFDS